MNYKLYKIENNFVEAYNDCDELCLVRISDEGLPYMKMKNGNWNRFSSDERYECFDLIGKTLILNHRNEELPVYIYNVTDKEWLI